MAGTRVARTTNRRGQGERLREELLDAAYALLVDTGDASGLSLRAVAARAGVAATSVYLHFADLQAIKVALAQRGFAAFATARDQARSGVDDPAVLLIAGCQVYARWAVDHPQLYRLMFSADLSPTFADPGAPNRTAFDALVASVRRCQDAGASPAGGDPLWTATLIWTALHGQVVLRHDRPHFPWAPLDEMVRDLAVRLAGLDPTR